MISSLPLDVEGDTLPLPLREGEGEWFASQKGEASPLDGRSAR